MRRGLLAAAITTAALFGAAGQARAPAPTIVNSSTWLEAPTLSGQTTNSSNKARISLVVDHDPGRKVTSLRIDDDWNGTDNTPTGGTLVSVTPQQPAGTFDYSRVSITHTYNTSGGRLSFSGERSG